MVYGGIITSAGNVAAFDEVMTKWRADHNMHSELKWTKVSNQKFAEYKSLVDLIFEHVSAQQLHFKSVVFDTHQIDYAHHKGNKELGFYKFYYQFLLHKFGPYATADDHRLYVFLDQRDTKYKLKVLCSVLNAGIRKKFGRTVDVVKQVEARDSKKTNLLQMADVIMGAIGHQNNDMHLAKNARKAKIDLAAYIAQKAGLKSLKEQTSYGRRDFEIWRFQFSKKPKK